MRFSECRGRSVLDTSTAEEIGRVDGFIVDAPSHRIHALRVGKHRDGSILRWGDIQAFGPDAITVESHGAVREPSEAPDNGDDIVGRLTLSDQGFELGTVADVEFDPATGELQQLHLGDRALDAAALLGSGSYAVVVRHPDAQA